MKIFRLTVTTSFFIFHALAVAAQNSDGHFQPLQSKRFIDKIEVFAGPSFSFNYGNKFVENYKGENIQNKRLLKVGYIFGLGVYRPISNLIDINFRVQYEKKGRKTELNTPLTSDTRAINFDDYSYKYFTVFLATRISLGKEENGLFLSAHTIVRLKVLKGMAVLIIHLIIRSAKVTIGAVFSRM